MIRLGYVTAHAYSGSTLFAFLLGGHPEIATVGEMTGVIESLDPDMYPCSCGELLRDCPFWTAMRKRMGARGIEFDPADFGTRFRVPGGGIADRLVRAGVQPLPLELLRSVGLRLVPRARSELAALLSRNEAFMRSACEITGREVFADVSKRPGRVLHLRKIPNLDVRIVHLVRDARGVINSSKKNMQVSAAEAAASWCREITAAERLRRYIDADRWLPVRYEDLCRDPEGTMKSVFAFLGVSPDGFRRDFRSAVHHIIGNQMRLASSSEIKLDEKWKSMLTAEDMGAYREIAQATNRRYGYADPAPA